MTTTTSLRTEAAHALEAAALDVETYGLGKHTYGGPGFPKCMQGALNYAVFGNTIGNYELTGAMYHQADRVERVARRALNVAIDPTYSGPNDRTTGRVVKFSDDSTTTVADAAAKFREAAAALRSEPQEETR